MPTKAIDQNGVLVIPNVQRSDAGQYVCMGSDMKTMHEAYAVLSVVECKCFKEKKVYFGLQIIC